MLAGCLAVVRCSHSDKSAILILYRTSSSPDKSFRLLIRKHSFYLFDLASATLIVATVLPYIMLSVQCYLQSTQTQRNLCVQIKKNIDHCLQGKPNFQSAIYKNQQEVKMETEVGNVWPPTHVSEQYKMMLGSR